MSKLTNYILEENEDTEWKPYFTNNEEMTCVSCNRKVLFFVKSSEKTYCHNCVDTKNMIISAYDLKRLEKDEKRKNESDYSCQEYGIWFRSKLEKDTFTLFHNLGLEIWYESKYFDEYLPDFFIPKQNIWIETRGHNQTNDIKDFIKNWIKLGIYNGRGFEKEPYLIDHVNIDVNYYQKQNDDISQADIDFIIEQKKHGIDRAVLDRFIALVSIKENDDGEYYYEVGDECSVIYDHRGNEMTPYLVRRESEWKIIDNIEFAKVKNDLDEAYYIYYCWSGSSDLFLKNAETNELFTTTDFIKYLK